MDPIVTPQRCGSQSSWGYYLSFQALFLWTKIKPRPLGGAVLYQLNSGKLERVVKLKYHPESSKVYYTDNQSCQIFLLLFFSTMPNHCNNSIHISTTIPFDEFLSRDEKWEYTFSFQKIVPMPWLLTQTISGSFAKAEIDLYFTKIKITRYKELKNNFLMFLCNKLYGYHEWYHWAINTWGTY